MQYGFAIDQRTCIGCHACTVACKTEHEIPVGQFRTWVKYVDKGEYPSSTREFGVMRCNHCTDAPCVEICPTGALFKRDDGIVDFDSDRCIGCKACMQACPYDAIYLDEDTNTAAKCNFCAHRVDEGLEPACVVVCPTQSIWVGDLADPESGISRFLEDKETRVRAPEQNTGPNVVYLGADISVLDPLEAPVEGTYIWAQPDEQRLATANDFTGTEATRAVTTLNTAHPRPWGWRVTTYLWTKSIGAGALLLAALATFLGLDLGVLMNVVAPALAVTMTATTGVLLVWDLKRPERFLYLFLKGNLRSWLVLGGYVLAVFGAVSFAWLVAGILGADDVVAILRWPAVPAAVLAAGYAAPPGCAAGLRDLPRSPHRGLRRLHLRVRRRRGTGARREDRTAGGTHRGRRKPARRARLARRGGGNLGGWQVSRCLFFLNVLTGSVGTVGGTSPNGWNKFVPQGPTVPEGHDGWNELLWPPEYPLSTNEMSILLPHLLADGRGRVSVYFSRVYNPVWTNPDGFSWIDALTDKDKVGLHIALTPTWSETATLADYVLPMGHSSERHDTHSYETHSGKWLGFRQPVRRVAMDKLGIPFHDTRDVNPGEVWEETEFWIELSWRIDPDGSLGIRRYFESPYRAGEKVTVDEYYRWVFENRVPGLPEKAAELGLSPLEYMRKFGVFEVTRDAYRQDERPLTEAELDGAVPDAQGVLRKPTSDESTPPLIGEAGAVGVRLEDGSTAVGWLTPSRKLELYSTTMADFGWPEHATPGYIESHVGRRRIDSDNREAVLVPTFRLPTLIHTRSGNAKYLNEISNTHPLWVNTSDAERLGIGTGDLVRVRTRIGYFVVKVWATQAIRPGVIALSHHMGRWRPTGQDGSRWVTGEADLQRGDNGVWRLRYTTGVQPFNSADPDSSRISWDDPGVHQNLTFPVQPDPISGMHCWHQKVRIEPAERGDRYGDVEVDVNHAHEVYREWLQITRPGPNEHGRRRPEFLMRPVKPKCRAFKVIR